MSVNKANKTMGYEEHLCNIEAYGMLGAGTRPMSNTPNPFVLMGSSSKPTTLWEN